MSKMTTRTENGITAEATIDMPEIEKAVKWYMRNIMKNTTDTKTIEGLVLVYDKAERRDDKILEDISFFKTEPSVGECQEFVKRLNNEIEKELQNPHTFLITGRLVEAKLNLQNGNFKEDAYSSRVEVCYDILKKCGIDYVVDVFETFAKMDCL